MFIVVGTTKETHQGAFIASCFEVVNLLDLVVPKQALINAFIICLQSQSLNFAL